MHDRAESFAECGQEGGEDVFRCDVTDAALEAAASVAAAGGAMSFPNAPTVSILIICCSFDAPTNGSST